jgi:ABC-2 type transport system permease protein
VTLEVETRKVTVDSIGIETNIPMNDWIEIGVYALRAEGESSAKVLYLQKHRIRSGKQTITVRVPSKPARAGIDPHHLLIDLEMDDNSKKVEIEN